MAGEESYDFVHVFISGSKDAVVWGFWHAARAIYQRLQRPEAPQKRSIGGLIRSFFSGQQSAYPTDFAVHIKSGSRDHALLLMYKGTRNQLSSEDVRSMVGLDTNKKPFTRCIVAKRRGEIEELLRTLYSDMKMSSEIEYETNTGIPDDSFLDYLSPPKDLHPSTWSQLAADVEESKTPEFQQPKLPEKNPAVAFSQFANELRCANCRKLNVAPEWPPRGDSVGFYYQTTERTQEKPGVYRVKVHCPYCNQDWFIVWDEDPS